MKRILTITTLSTVLAGGGWVLAQTAPPPKGATAAPAPKGDTSGGGHEHGTPAPAHDHGTPGGEHRAPGAEHGMMGGGMMGGGHGMGGGYGMMEQGMCPMMVGGANTKVDVKKLDKGVVITLTSSDAATVVRLQKMAEAMRLKHDATTP